MVMLTATLPPSEEEELYRRMYVEKEHVQIFRASTVRKNVAYRVIDISGIGRKRDKEKMVLGLIQKNIRKHSTGKVVVYSNTVPKAKTIAESLGCDAYHHHAVGKEHMLDDFREGRQPIIVATSALGMGVDIPDIRCIIHVDRMWGTVEVLPANAANAPDQAAIDAQARSELAPLLSLAATATDASARVSKVVDAVAFCYSFDVSKSHLRDQPDTRRSFWPEIASST